jgi:TRAP-type C4-dicarboxylate transport system permease small subunit
MERPAPGAAPADAAAPEPAVLRALAGAIGWINRAAMALSAAGVLVSLALIGWAVVMRYAFNSAPVWVDEVVGFMLVGIVMLAAADVLRRGEHIGVDVLTANLSGRRRLWARAWASLAALAAALVLVVNGWQTAMFSRLLGIVTEGHLELPVFWLMLLLPLGGLLMALTAVEALARLACGAAPLAAPHLPDEAPE